MRKTGNWWSSSQNSDTNMWNMNNGSPNNNNKTNNNTIFPAYEYQQNAATGCAFLYYYKMSDDEFVPWDDLLDNVGD